MHLRNVCVYCGSRPGRRTIYLDAARELADAIVERNLGLVYGGASVGLMGALADAVLNNGGSVVGVIPHALARKEIAHDGLSSLIVTESMHERKMVMSTHSDAFVAMPGGIGTLEELFEMWTWGQLGIHAKPCGLLNIGSYFDGLAGFLDHAVDEAFVKPPHRAMLMIEDSPAALLDRFVSYESPDVEKWVTRTEV